MPIAFFKKEHDRWLPAVVACLVLIGGALWASVLFPPPVDKPAPAEAATTVVTEPPFAAQTLRTWEGQVARFAGEGALPDEVYDVAVATLPTEVQEQLTVGIVVTCEEDLLMWIENLTS